MTPERWQKVKELVASALEREPEKRSAFIEQTCGDDEEVRKEVESLLASHEPEDSFMELPAVGVAAQSLAEDPAGSLVGQHIGPYEIIRELGRGGMGDVYLAQDSRLRRQVALKLLPQHFTIDAERVRRFEQEAQAASSLNHPNIVTVHEIGRADSIHFIITEFIDGMTLRDRIASSSSRAASYENSSQSRGLQLVEALDIAGQIASALAAAHEAGIVHRDIKPENVMLRRDGFVKVLDFGLAKLTSDEVTAASPDKLNTHPGRVMGTVQYMSPEQARGQEVDQRTDIWSLGVILYEMISGNVPFSGETPSHVVVSILENQPPAVVQNGDVPRELEEIIAKALNKNREERYQTASELALELKRLKQDVEVEARLNPSVTQSSEIVVKRFGHTADRSGASTLFAMARPASSAEYLVREIKRHKRGAIVAAAILILMFTTLAYSFYLKRNGLVAHRSEPIDSLAILPFVNESGEPNTDHLADGISDSVIDSLSRLSKLRVISRNAALRYKGKQTDPRKAGRELKVQAVLIGRMTQRGDGLTIGTELVDVSDNSRLWGEQYNRKLSDILSVQEEIARKISEGLRLRLTGEEKKQLEKRATQDPEAYLLYSLGRSYSRKGTKEGWEKSIEYYEQAIAVDPSYAPAYVGLSNAYFQLHWRGFLIPKEGWRKSEWAALKAVEVDETLSEAHVALARSKRGWDWSAAEREYKRALELDPNSVGAYRDYATYLAFSSRFDEALVSARRTEELDQASGDLRALPFLPFIHFLARQYDTAIAIYLKSLEKLTNNAQVHFFLGETYLAKGMYKESVEQLQKAVALDNIPERWDRYPMLAYAYAAAGQREEALEILAEQKRLAKQRYIASYNFSIIYTGLGDKDSAFKYLNKSIDEGFPATHVKGRPMFDSLRSDPRYAELLQRMNVMR